MLKKINLYLLQLFVFLSLNATAAIVKADQPFIGEVRWFAGNYAPRGWQFCDGQLLPIAQYSSLYSILGITYGGDGRTTFGLPDLRGRAMIHEGNGPGLTARGWGEKGGSETETITSQQMPSHSHVLNTNSVKGDSASPVGNVISKAGRLRVYDPPPADTSLSTTAIGTTGGTQAHNNIQPFVTISCIIATEGLFPPRS